MKIAEIGIRPEGVYTFSGYLLVIYAKCLIAVKARSITHKTGDFYVFGIINATTRP